MIKKVILCAVIVSAMVLPICSWAGNLVQNGSFETNSATDPFSTLVAGSSVLNNWTVSSAPGTSGGNVDLVGDYWPAADGHWSVDLGGTPGPGEISQTINGLQVGQSYNLSFSYTGNWDMQSAPFTPRTADIGIGVDGVMTTSVTAGKSVNDGSRIGQWQKFNYTFTANSSSTTLSFWDASQPGDPYRGPVIDNVSVSAVPEPGTIVSAMGLLAPAGLLFRRRRSRTIA